MTLAPTQPQISPKPAGKQDLQLLRERLKVLFDQPDLLPDKLLGYLTEYVSLNMGQVPVSQLSGFRGVRAGQIDSTGTITSGVGFTVAKPATGQYTITFDAAFALPPTVVATCLHATQARECVISAVSETAVSIFTFDGGGGTVGNPTDASFHFFVVASIT
jgi:hypothetical protein